MEILRADSFYFYSNNPQYSQKNTELPGLCLSDNTIFSEFYLEVQFFLFIENEYFYISDDIRYLQKISKSEINIDGIIQLAIFKANFYPFSIFKNIIPIPIGAMLKIRDGDIKIEKLNFSIEYKDIDQSFINIHKTLSEYSNEAGKTPYMMYSGGIDSSICFWYLNNPKTIAGSSIFCDDHLNDVENGIKLFKFHKKNYEFQKSWNFVETIKNYNFFSPFIDLGVYDDLLHVKKAYEMKATSVVNGLGPDEIMAVAFCREGRQLGDFDYFLNKYSMLKHNILFSLFDKERVRYVFEQSIRDYDFEDIYHKIIFTLDYHQIPLQHGLTRNNSKFFPDIRRIFPFANNDFFSIIYGLPENLIYNNGIEKYFLRLFASQFMPLYYSAKKKMPFDADYYRIIKENRHEIDGFLTTEMRKIPHFNLDIIEISEIEPMDRLNLFMFVNCVKSFFDPIFHSTSPV